MLCIYIYKEFVLERKSSNITTGIENLRESPRSGGSFKELTEVNTQLKKRHMSGSSAHGTSL